MRSAGAANLIVLAAVAMVMGGAGCDPSFDDERLRSIAPDVDAPCDPDGVELAYDVEYFPSDGEHILRSIEVRDLDAACAGATLRLEVAGSAGVLGGGSASVPADGRVRVLFDPVDEVMGADGETFLRSNLEVLADDVRAVTISIR